MDYYKIVENARKNGTLTDANMIRSCKETNEILKKAEEGTLTNDELISFMRRQYELFNGPHYDEDFARNDVSKIKYTGKSNDRRTGEYWTKQQIEEVTRGKSFPSGTTSWDKYVAFNVFYSDLCQLLSEDDIIKCAYKFFFDDEDAEDGKIWRYMQAVR